MTAERASDNLPPVRFRALAAASGLALSCLGAGCLIYGEDLLSTGGTGGGGTGGSPTTTSTGTMSTGTPCVKPEDCPDPGSPCRKRTCTDQVCGTENLPANTELPDPMPGNCHGSICDSGGMPIEVENSADIPDDGNFCTFDTCELGEPKHTAKIGYACNDNGGKYCSDQGQCVACISNGNCMSQVCKDYMCAPSGCADGAKNGTETDIDCGGECVACDTGKKCSANTDCKGGLCMGTVCAATCSDSAKNNSETDVDCGGNACMPCADGKACISASDCLSQICAVAKCAVPTCTDGQKNGAETGVDCGGPTCGSCPLDHIVINEIDYDQVGTDSAEFIEIYNATVGPVSLAGYKIILVDGISNQPYAFVDLAPAGSLAAGQYLVVGPPGFAAAPGAAQINFSAGTNQLQNGQAAGVGSPDGVALIDDANNKLIDALSYEGAIASADLSTWGLGTVSLVEGVALNASVKDEAAGALCRYPNSKDTDSAAADWMLCTTPTPGAPNSL